MLHPLVIARKDQVLQTVIGFLFIPRFARHTASRDAYIQYSSWLPPGSTDHYSGNPTVRMDTQKRTGHKGTHGMPQQDIREVRVPLSGILQQLIAVFYRRKPAAVKISLHTLFID